MYKLKTIHKIHYNVALYRYYIICVYCILILKNNLDYF